MSKSSRKRSVPSIDPDGPRTSGVASTLGAATRRKRRQVVAAAIAMLAVAGFLLINAVLVERQSSAGSEGSLVDVDGVSMYVREDGPRDAPALVLIHGLGGSTRWWDAVVPALVTSHLVIRVDLLGHGRSAKPTGAVYSVPEQARRVGLVLDRVGVRHAIVVGHSTGGSVATALAEQRGDLVTALTLIDTGPSMDAFISDGPVGKLLFAPGVGQLLWRIRTDSIIRKGLRTAFSRSGYEIPQQLVDDVRAMTYHSLTAMSQAADDYLVEQALPARLAAVGQPVLVIFGQDDQRWRSSSSAAEYRRVPGARVELVSGVGHSPMLEDPQRTAVLISAFADTVR
ncbi:alpha/beta fold hydrolase [Micromonospora sp. MS34]|uniref:alpha/beta fold hydrolase n=1 Tax=Micromonospora sp. MS34 TaxID=3385971 RepID=UPI0039A1FBD8